MIDGSKALRNAVNAVFGNNPVQRCRKHKLSNVMDHLPKELKDQVKSVLQACWRLDTEEGKKRIKEFIERERYTFPVLLDPKCETFDLYKVKGIPTTFLVDKKGMMIGKAIGPRDWKSPEVVSLLNRLIGK